MSAAVPPVGAVVIPAYTAYNYSKLGYSLYKAYDELSSKGTITPKSAKRAAGSLGELATQPAADDFARELTAKAQDTGAFAEMAKASGVDSKVFAEMVRGSTSSALSTSGGELAKFVVAGAVGA